MKYSNFTILKKLVEELNGQYIEREYHHSAKAKIDYNGFDILFDNYTKFVISGNLNIEQKYTRVTMKFKSNINFTFELSSKDLIGKMFSFFNSKYNKIDLLGFDKYFLIKTNNKKKLHSLLLNKNLRNDILNFKYINLLISDVNGIWEEKLPSGTYELAFFIENTIEDLDLFISIYNLFKKLIDKLIELNNITSS